MIPAGSGRAFAKKSDAEVADIPAYTETNYRKYSGILDVMGARTVVIE
jgi:hypothetical protein